MTDRPTVVVRTQQTRTQTQQPSSGSTGIYNDEDLKTVDATTRFTHTLLKSGFTVKGADGSSTYDVVSALSYMPYGDIYKVQNVQKIVFTMKTENDTLHSRLGGMKKEVEILDFMKGVTDKKKGKHFPLMLDRACVKGQLKYVIYKRMGPDLETVRRSVIARNFSRSTAMRISVMILRTISDLHSLGFVHRDIRLSHFWVGTGADFQNIYLMDFSKVRKFRTDDGKIRPRQKTSDCVYNVHKYLSRRAQKGQDTGPRDDLESWLYVTLDLFEEGSLPWKKDRTRRKMLRKKRAVMCDPVVRTNISKVVHPSFTELLMYVNELKWETEVRFPLLEDVMITIGDLLALHLSRSVDWPENSCDTVLPPLNRPKIEVGADMTKSEDVLSGGKKNSRERRSTTRVRQRRTAQAPSEMESVSPKPKPGSKKKRVVNEDDEDNEDDLDDDESFQGTTTGAGGGGKNYIRSSGILAGVTKYQRPAKQEAKESDYDNVVWTAHQEAAALAATGSADGAAADAAAPAAAAAAPAHNNANKQEQPSH